MPIIRIILPELIVGTVACLLFLFGISNKPPVRRAAAAIALATLVGVFAWLCFADTTYETLIESSAAVRLGAFGHFIKLLTAGVGILLVLLNWPSNATATGNRALNFGEDAGEFFGLMLLSLAGLMLVASANDLMLLFLAIELASLPAYVMVSISRPLPVAQEAGVKYFFLGAMAAAILLFGLSYLYGSTGLTSLYAISTLFHSQIPASPADPFSFTPVLTTWQLLAIVIVIIGLLFKLAAVPFHSYVGDVYEGAATPVTAFLGFVPKASGLVALLKILFVASGGTWHVSPPLIKLIWWLAALTMTFGNVLGILQKHSVKRALAYSSVANSGYLLVGVAALIANPLGYDHAIQATLFYLAAYALMNTGAFAVLTALPARDEDPNTSAETYDDLAGAGRKHLWLGLAMAICCFSLIGLPLTVGFFGKLIIVQPALSAHLTGLVVILVINAGISAAYYLRIVGALFLRLDPSHGHPAHPGYHPHHHPAPHNPLSAPLAISLAVWLSAGSVLLLGTLLPATQILSNHTLGATILDNTPQIPTSEPARTSTAAAPL
ncbi:MAG TPA: NADH-quinone oxidoreductase subunit N [Tepidisphaeraceae bacterium]|jgi:NADH-quinone oxidoreductase subunit N|nr:NADH-quinone oxidoreductase subunit N [Tepidisphaeraceae bacterium]